MALDNVKNFVKVAVSGTYSDTDTSITLESNSGASLPAPPFNLVWWDSVNFSSPQEDSQREIVRVTGISGDTLTVIRAQEGTTAVSHTAGSMILALTAKTITDINEHITNTSNPHGITPAQIGAITSLEQDVSPKLGGDLDSNGKIVLDSDEAISNDVLNKLVIYKKRLTITTFDTYDFVGSSVNGSGTVLQQFAISRVSTGTTANSEALEYLNSAAMSLASGIHILTYVYTSTLTGDTLGFIGVSSTLLSGQTTTTLTSVHAGIFYDNGTYYASTADGTNQQITTLTIAGFSDYLHLYYDGTSVYFYIGDTLVATHTTYAAAGAYPQVYVNNKGNGIDTKIYWYNFLRR